MWSSDDGAHWTPLDSTFYGSRGDVVVSGGRAWWFYFGGQRVGNVNWAVIANSASPFTPAPASENFRRRGIPINVVEVKLMFTNPNEPVYIDLKSEREMEKINDEH